VFPVEKYQNKETEQIKKKTNQENFELDLKSHIEKAHHNLQNVTIKQPTPRHFCLFLSLRKKKKILRKSRQNHLKGKENQTSSKQEENRVTNLKYSRKKYESRILYSTLYFFFFK
jgi:hypothetical protein